MFKIGDIVEIYAPSVGYRKYHLCIKEGSAETLEEFLFLNSDPNFDDVFVVECARVPCLPVSESGVTVVSFALITRFSHRQLGLYEAKKKGELDPGLAAEILEFAKTVRTMTGAAKKMVLSALSAICGAKH